MRTMPAGRKWMLPFCVKIDNVDPVFAKAQRGLNGFDKTRAIFRADYNPILNDLHARTKPFDFLVRIDAHNCIADPNAKVTLLLKKIEEVARLRFCRYADPKCDQDCFAVQLAQNLIGD